jgi:tRNA(Ile)-lysidine synthase
LINLSRGTGLDGLTGFQSKMIKYKTFAFIFKGWIANYKENNIEWREDSSNASDKYLRNKIRHHLVPLLKEINPQFLEVFIKLKTIYGKQLN